MKEYNLIGFNEFNAIEIIARTIISITCLYVLGTSMSGFSNVILVIGIILILYIMEPIENILHRKKIIKYVQEKEDLK